MNSHTSISEFERTKPTVTMHKINELIKLIEDERVKTEILYKDRIRSLESINDKLKDMKNSFKKGE
jgi:D-arabinose 1-dehydrogenase-like Zn-dependent alcohol dehydrogenase